MKEPDKYIVKPAIFRKHVFDVIWFGWILGILEIIEECHRQSVFPALVKLF